MSSFTSPLYVRVEQKEEKRRGLLTLIRPFEYHVGHLGSGEVITVPTGFQTDGLSIPGILRWWFPVLGKAGKAAVVHDYILYTKMYSKKRAAEIFLECMEVLEVSKTRRTLMYWAVRYWPWISDVRQYDDLEPVAFCQECPAV